MINDNVTPFVSGEYDRNIRQTLPYYEIFHAEVLDLVDVYNPSPACWLDTGCGTGYLVEKAAERYSGTTFLLCDPSPDMLLKASQRLGSFSETPIKFLSPATTKDLDVAGEQVPDVITSIMCHQYMPQEEREATYRNVYKLLADSGIYITIEHILPKTERGLQFNKQRWGAFQERQGKAPEQVEKHLARLGTKYFPIPLEEHFSLLKACGFTTIELFWFSYLQAGIYAIKER